MAEDDTSRWLVIGGDCLGIFLQCPPIRSGWSAPPLPIAIHCHSLGEAWTIQRVLQTLLNAAPPQPSSTELLSQFGASPAVLRLLSHDQNGFYPVAIGTRVGIHCTCNSAIATWGSFNYPQWRRTDTLWEALAYMVV
ncbi:hypothetical protein HYDPIDRAFT_27973 [Hydnomerulius pinastri MD-312]|uniref:Uncharacterized protein n=1 Tax=Hydnomerulius pinastri MD-312 TaxID=994086 RepID=A0A0C9WB27_9AGAM|nr:hypothetical protein HYDPIDRAFT_27973 [Hydnomerulius pinastri MD-312]